MIKEDDLVPPKMIKLSMKEIGELMNDDGSIKQFELRDLVVEKLKKEINNEV